MPLTAFPLAHVSPLLPAKPMLVTVPDDLRAFLEHYDAGWVGVPSSSAIEWSILSLLQVRTMSRPNSPGTWDPIATLGCTPDIPVFRPRC